MQIKIFLISLFMIFLSSCSNLKILWEDSKKGKNTICLTFDDGPNGISTKKVIYVLEKNNVPATFFVIGENVKKQPNLLKEISMKGYSIGNHTYDHDVFLFAKSKKDIESNILKNNQLIESITGKKPNFFRPPNAIINDNTELACKETNMIPVGVNIFVNDSMSFKATTIYENVVKNLKEGSSILVLHDGFGTIENQKRTFVSEALDNIIKKLKRAGYKFGKLDSNGLCQG